MISTTAFQKRVLTFYHTHARSFPWRRQCTPYKIFVSEIMLQQTQADRVVAPYRKFLKQFPSWKVLAAAPTHAVLRTWQGLGYNRRALALHRSAKIIRKTFHGRLPNTIGELEALPGVGPYTARAVDTFVNDVPHVLIETNIRTVYLHHFFSHRNDVSDMELSERIAQTLPRRTSPRIWYWALMDYGAFLKRSGIRSHTQSKHYTKQAVFKGSNRELRGQIIALVTEHRILNEATLYTQLSFPKHRIDQQVHALQREGFFTYANGNLRV